MALFDTLKAAMRLQEEGGFDERQAGAIVATVTEAVDDRATKADLVSLEQRLTIRMGMMFTAATGMILAAIGIATGVIVST